jgi:beta-lactamase regulating signal transducer with metallopeptidase domain
MGAVMPAMMLTMNRLTDGWLDAMATILWQSTLVIMLVTVVAWCLRRSSPAARFWLWQIVAVKLLLMPFWTFAVPIPSPAKSQPSEQTASAQLGNPAAENAIAPAVLDPLSPSESPPSEHASLAAPRRNAYHAVSWQAWLLLAWVAVILGQLARLLVQRVRLVRILEQTKPANAELAGCVAELARQVGLRKTPMALLAAAECPLFVCGLWRPQIVLPSRLLTSLEPPARRQVILHELAHIKRHDLAWWWPIELAQIVYFFHPMVYWVAYQLRLERELACDQLAMAHGAHRPADYAQTLVQVVGHASEPTAIAAGLAGGEPLSKQRSQVTDL